MNLFLAIFVLVAGLVRAAVHFFAWPLLAVHSALAASGTGAVFLDLLETGFRQGSLA